MNAKCTRAAAWISRLIDGELDGATRKRLDAHLEICPECRSLQKNWQAIGERIRKDNTVSIPDPDKAWSDIRRAIRTASVSGKWELFGFPVMSRWLPAAAATIAVVAGVFFTIRPRPAEVPELASASSVEYVETDLPDASPVVYVDAKSGWTVVWVDQQPAPGKRS